MAISTAFRGKVIIKDQYKELVELINNNEWEKAEVKFPFVQEYTKVNENKKIPFSKNEIENALEEDGFLYLYFHSGTWDEDHEYFTNLDGNVWSFIADVKDYLDPEHNIAPISSFIQIILSEVAIKIIKLEKWYPEYDLPIDLKIDENAKLLN
ncbi:hypothetical protein [Metabacillus fastidiosus]|uniref:hypothetical protein n=1 Tax=Metabacillus fastidiosus TaxID=1458 RepID=UPI002E1E3990|nr:hypothetical protein [Metabacillus fastidiosus]